MQEAASSLKPRSRPWLKEKMPLKIMAIRFQALGDTIITMPYLLDLKVRHPEIRIDFLTRKEVSAIPSALDLFNRVFAVGGKRSVRLQLLFLLWMLPRLWVRHYDVVIDLQNNKLTRLIRKLLFVRAWSEFDSESLLPAGERTRKSIDAAGWWTVSLNTNLVLRHQNGASDLLREHGAKAGSQLIILNPAGYCLSRNWPIRSYVDFAMQWLLHVNPQAQFVLLLLPSRKEEARVLSNELGIHCIDLTGYANQVTAFAIVSKASLMLSEDSGLMHMAWVQGIPTLALFSSSRKAWSAPLGARSLCLDSSDMECGPCMLEVCKYGDNRCLSRYSPRLVMEKAAALLELKIN